MSADKRIAAEWLNERRTVGYMLQADGELFRIERADSFDVWGPPEQVGDLLQSVDEIVAGMTASMPL